MNDRMILVVDDEYELLEMVKSIFERAGFTQVLTASSGEAALKMCKEQMPDMMILDVMMPGMDGFAILKELRKTSKIPVLMLTARGEAEDKFMGFETIFAESIAILCSGFIYMSLPGKRALGVFGRCNR